MKMADRANQAMTNSVNRNKTFVKGSSLIFLLHSPTF